MLHVKQHLPFEDFLLRSYCRRKGRVNQCCLRQIGQVNTDVSISIIKLNSSNQCNACEHLNDEISRLTETYIGMRSKLAFKYTNQTCQVPSPWLPNPRYDRD